MEVATRFNAALDAAFRTGDRESVYAFFADDIEYMTPHRTLLQGLSEIREKLKWGSGRNPENLDVEFAQGEWRYLGDGHVASESRAVQRWKETGEVAAVMTGKPEAVAWLARCELSPDGKVIKSRPAST